MSDSEDDLPIAELIKKRSRQQQQLTDSKKVKTESKKNSPSSNNTTSNGRSNNHSSSASKSADFYENFQKGLLVQRFLVRWWYSMEWPLPHEIGVPPQGYELLDGFPGVFISTQTDSLGKILDLRNKSNCPSLINISKFPASKIKQLCITAYEKQMALLIESEGEDTKLLNILKSELKEVKRIDAELAEKEAKKFTFHQR